jgi:repressor LexA
LELTKREAQILEYIKGHIREKGYPPAVREIGRAVGLSSTSTVHAYLRRLEQKGYLRRDPTLPRALVVAEGAEEQLVSVPLLGRVAAGVPVMAEENWEDVLRLPASFLGSGEFFALRVRGDSMVGAGVLEGDIVIVRRQPTAENGDIVVALVEGEATVKRFYRENGRIRLQPENSAMEPIITDNVEILGKVVSLLRKY